MSGRGDLLLAFAAATAIHAGVLAVGFPSDGGGGAGDGGSDRLSIEAASPSVAAMVREWERPPAVSETTAVRNPDVTPETILAPTPVTNPDRASRPLAPEPATPPTAPPDTATDAPSRPDSPAAFPEAPKLAAMDEPLTRPAVPNLGLPETAADAPSVRTAPPPLDTAPRIAERPSPRPGPASSPAVTRKVATGMGETGTRGTTSVAPAPKASQAAQQAAASAWAAEIQRRIARHHAYPPGSRDEGRVRVAMVVLPDGKLSRVSVVKSSGSSRLDEAAVDAVTRAAPFPPAPKSLDDEWFSVGQWISFEKR